MTAAAAHVVAWLACWLASRLSFVTLTWEKLRVARLGLEPRTDGLKVRCSTIELTRR
jgi:hypothetical protein